MNVGGISGFDTASLEPARGRDYRLPLVILLTVLLATYFWTQSRYPALEEKALMGGDTPLSGLAFDVAIEVIPGSDFLSALWANTINWLVTNKKGMTFGVLFGAMALTLLSLLQKRSFRNGFANSARGALIGAPLGVCVNCAVPIALGLHAGRLRLETTLSAMIASPTLNVIVVTMSFALLPVQVAAVKLFASLMMVLVGIPLLCRFVLKSETDATRHAHGASAAGQKLGGFSGWLMRKLSPREFEAGEYGPWKTVRWFARTFGRNFLFIFIVTVPMMFAAAMLGAFFVEVFSPTSLVGVLPRGSWPILLTGMVLLALVMSFAPAPIALDVILTIVLISLGMQDDYGAVTVVALGSFSVYAFIVIWRAISLRTAVSLWLMVVAAAVCSGVLANILAKPAEQYKLDSYRQILATEQGATWPAAPDTERAVPLAELRPRIEAQRIAPIAVAFEQSGDAAIASVSALPLAGAAPASGNTVFGRIMGRDIGIGITEPLHSLARSFLHLFEGGVAAGDIHGDGWTDLALRKSFLAGGLALYANVGGRFVRQQADLGPVDKTIVHVVAFADLDGDGALDLVVTTERRGNYLFWNRDGGFDTGEMMKLPGDDRAISQSLAFADFDRDGRLDIAVGNAAIGISAPGFGDRYAEAQPNKLLLNRGIGSFEELASDEYPGQTLTLLASDFDRNGTIDLLSGDDVANTDEFALFRRDGSFSVARDALVPFPFRMRTSMSYDEGDYNNDLVPDYYGGEIAMPRRTQGTADRIGNLKLLCAQLGADQSWRTAQRDGCLRELNEISKLKGAYQSGLQSGCERMRTRTYRLQCAARAMTQFYNRNRTDAPDRQMYRRCRRELGRTPRFVELCDTLLISLTQKPSSRELDAGLGPTLNDANILLTGKADGGFSENSAAQGMRRPGWTWDARFTDLDQDGWQDLYVLTGYWARAPEGDVNRLYHNVRGSFVEASEAFGLGDPLPSLSAVRLDYDRDGDVDLIRSLSGPNVIVHRNDRPAGKALWVYLRQSGGNSMAVGARVTICTDGETRVRPGKCQVRPIKASGGYQSFDPIAAHFGLGKARAVSLIEIRWPDGKHTLLRPHAVVGGEIVIRR